MEKIEFEHIVSTMRPQLAALCQSILSPQLDCEEAEDIVQETWVRLWKMRDKLDQYQNIEALGMTIAKNLCIDKLRQHKHRQNLYAVESLDDMPSKAQAQCTSSTSSDEAIIGKDTMRQIKQALAKLPDTQRRMLLMRSKGMSLDEIALACGANKTSTKTMISAARRAMLKMMNQRLGEF